MTESNPAPPTTDKPQEGFARRLMFHMLDQRLKTGHGGWGVDKIPEEQARALVAYARLHGFLKDPEAPAPSPASPKPK